MFKRVAAAIIASAALVGIFDGPANAKSATWSNDGLWHVTGDTSTMSCIAGAEFDHGYGLLIHVGKSGFSLAVSGVNVSTGASYAVRVASSIGGFGSLPGIAISDKLVVFERINEATVLNLARAHTFTIEGIGSFDLRGSNRAILSTIECFEALNSY